MPCFKPLRGYYARRTNENGKRAIVFSVREGHIDRAVMLPCGKCQGCLLERSRVWAFRCVHEASMYQENCFITLTYDDAHVPSDGGLRKEDFVKFMKRLRRFVCDYEYDTRQARGYVRRERKCTQSGVRFFHCGEYGERFGRPHHHACIFNFNFSDRVPFSRRGGVRVDTSRALSELWPDGFSTVGDVTFESAAYVARYVMKKLVQEDAPQFYAGKQGEYVSMSRRPGIGRPWYEAFKGDVFPGDQVVIRGGVVCKPPRYYGNIYELTDPERYAQLKAARMRKALASEDSDAARMSAKAIITGRRVEMLSRKTL